MLKIRINRFFIQYSLMFAIASLLIRFAQGVGEACVTATCIFIINYLYVVLSIISFEYPDQKDKYFGYAESAIGIGLIMGPVLG